MKRIKDHFSGIPATRWLVAGVIVIISIIVPALGVPLAHELAPAEWFYSIKTPVEIDHIIYKPCEVQTLHMVRQSIITSTADSHRQLKLIGLNGIEKIYSGVSTPIVIDRTNGYEEVEVNVTIPCDIPDGNYYWKAVVNFEVGNTTKQVSWKTGVFQVNKDI